LQRPAKVLLATSSHDPHPGLLPGNVVNRLATQGGLQIEQATALRRVRPATRTVAEVVRDELASLPSSATAERPAGGTHP